MAKPNTYHKLRVDLSDEVPMSAVHDVVRSLSNTYLYCVEGGDENPHCHFYVELSKTSVTLRNKLKALGLRGNASYSLKSLDERYPIEYLAYIVKQSRWKNHGVPQDVLELALAHDLKVKEQMAEKKLSRRTQLQKIEDACKFSELKDPPSADCIIKAVVAYYKESGTLVREFQLVAISQTLALKYSPKYDSMLASRIYDKGFAVPAKFGTR